MNDHLAQLTSLATYGNDFLMNDRLDLDFSKKNKSFQFCRFVYFTDSNQTDIASNPNEWFNFLKKDGCKKLKLLYQHSEINAKTPDHYTAGVIGGGGTWLIESVYSDYSKYWSSKWFYKYPYAQDRRFFDANYRRQFKKHEISNNHIEVEYVKKELGSVLWNISEFANNQGYEKWVDFFDNAMNCLYGENPRENYIYDDMIPASNYTLSEQQLIFGAGKAWCFGRERSWNDMDFKDKQSTERYLSLSAILYDAIVNSILAIANK